MMIPTISHNCLNFVSEFWVCRRVLGLFRTFHAHITIFCFRVFGLFRTFHAHTSMLNAHPIIFFSEFWVCLRVLGLFRTFHTHTTMLDAHPTIFCSRISGLFQTFHIHTTLLNAQHPILERSSLPRLRRWKVERWGLVRKKWNGSEQTETRRQIGV